MSIPEIQQKSPAGHPDLPYLPVCSQLESQPGSIPNWNAHGPVIDGVFHNWHGIPTGWEKARVEADLSAWGYCTTDPSAIEVPYKVDESIEKSENQGIPPVYSQRVQDEINLTQTEGIPNIYTDRITQIQQSAEGGEVNSFFDPATTFVGLSLFGGFILFRHVILPRYRTQAATQLITRIQDDPSEQIAQEKLDVPVASARPSTLAFPSVPIYAGTLIEQEFSGKNMVENSRKTPGKLPENMVENSENPWKSFGKLEIEAENSGKFPEFSGNEAEIIQLFRDRLLEAETHAEEEFSAFSEGHISGYEIDINNEEAKQSYFALRDADVESNTVLSEKLFGVKGGRRWSEVNDVLNYWSEEYESYRYTTT